MAFIDDLAILDDLLGESAAPKEAVPTRDRVRFAVGAVIQSKANPGIQIQVTKYMGMGYCKGLAVSEEAKRKYKTDYAICGNDNWSEITKEVP